MSQYSVNQNSDDNYLENLVIELIAEIRPLITLVERTNADVAHNLMNLLEALNTLLESLSKMSFKDQLFTITGLASESFDLKNQIEQNEGFLNRLMSVRNVEAFDDSTIQIIEPSPNYNIEECSSFPLPLSDFDQTSSSQSTINYLLNGAPQCSMENFPESSRLIMPPPRFSRAPRPVKKSTKDE